MDETTQATRQGLTRHTVVAAALKLLNEVGLDGLTTRRLAAELSVQSPSLYWHFRNKQELLDQMAEAILLAGGMGGPRDGESWQDWLTRRARNYRSLLLAHRDGACLVANARLGPAAVRLFDQELTAMVGCGFSPVLALRTIAALSRYVTGFVLQEQTERRQAAQAPPDQLAALAELLDGGTSATLLVAIREGGSPLAEPAFEYGVEALIDGTTAALARQRSRDQA
jgi:TetR/AcrR family transcriptional regulator, tetracycline repressor protein